MNDFIFFGVLMLVGVMAAASACKDSGITLKGFIAGLKDLWR